MDASHDGGLTAATPGPTRRALLRAGVLGTGVLLAGAALPASRAQADIVATQTGWRWCKRCQGLFYGPNLAASRCPAGGAHDGTDPSDYHLTYGNNPPPAGMMTGWTWCARCQGLIYAAFRGSGQCPASYYGHDESRGGNYFINVAPAPGEDNWRLCAKCLGIFYAGIRGSRCPSGGPHDAAWLSGNNFVLVYH